MDAYYRKTRRPNAALSSSIKRPPPISEPKLQQQATKDETNDQQNTTQDSLNIARVSRNISSAGSPAKTPSPPPRPRPTTPTNARIARPKQPPPVRRKLAPDDRSKVRTSPKKTPRDLFRSLHLLDSEDASQDKDEENNNDSNSAHPSKTTTTQDIAASFGLKRLVLPATPPATPVKQPARRVPEPQSSKSFPELPSKITTGPLKGVSSSLLDLIRAKEAKAKEITPEQIRLKELLGIAPEIARIVPTVFTVNKKDFLLYDKVVEKCFKGLKTHYTTDTIIECLGVMAKIAPEWVSVVDISKGRFMRYNKDKYTLPQLMVAIQRYQREKSLVK